MDIVAAYARRTIALANGEILMDDQTPRVFAQPELLEKTFVEPPQVSQIAHALADLGVARDVISIDQLVQQFVALYSSAKGG